MRLFRSLTIALIILAASGSLTALRAAGEWTQVKSKNFNLIGNASEKDIRKVGTKLEQFRESFKLIFNSANLDSRIPTNVVVFKSDAAYKQYKPKRADGKIDDEVAGYFQSGEDVNYITLSVGGNEKETFGTIFHEYVHYIVNTNFKSEMPQWFNEGLAEYYQTYEIAGDIKIRLGLPQQSHLSLLQLGSLMSLEKLVNMSNFELHQTSGRTRDMFYAQSWALVHYLTNSSRAAALDKFLKAILSGSPGKKAFQEAFEVSYEKLESELRAYIVNNAFNFQEITLKKKLTYDNEMASSPLDDASVNSYLGELLLLSQRPDEAEPMLLAALKASPDLPVANSAMAKLRLSQRKFDEARGYLEKVIAAEPKDHLAYYRYANLLGREGRDEYGFVSRIEPGNAAKMREALKKAIAIEPAFAESYELLAFVLFVNNQELDTAIGYLQTALKYQPANPRLSLRIAEILTRQNKFEEASRLVENIAATTLDPDIKSRASSLHVQIAELKESAQQQEAEKKAYDARIAAAGGSPLNVKRVETRLPPTEEETAKQNEFLRMRALNQTLRKTLDSEQRVSGSIQRIDCRRRPLAYTIKTATESFTVTSKDFNDLFLRAHDAAAMKVQVGCDANIGALNALITYKGSANSKAAVRGELVAIEFIPADFRFMTEDEMRTATLIIYDDPEVPKPQKTPEIITLSSVTTDIDARRSVIAAREISDALRKPLEGEKREIGFLDKIECTAKGNVFHIKVGNELRRVINYSAAAMRIYLFTPDLGHTQFACGIPPVEFPAVFVYKPISDPKAKLNGEIVSLEFVPKSFVLDQ